MQLNKTSDSWQLVCFSHAYFGKGNFNSPGTAHYRGSGLNDYQWLITTIGASIISYSYSHEIPVYGFGGKFEGKDYDCFQCGKKAAVHGVTGLLEAYDQVFSTDIAFGDRCKFDSVIMAAAQQAQTKWVRPE